MKNKILNVLLILLILLEPMLEIFWLKNGFSFSIGPFTLSTIVRYILVLLVYIIIILKYRNLKYKKVLFLYIALLFVYFIFHILNSKNFNSYIPDSFSLFEEIYYFVRMTIPISLIYVVINSAYEEKQLKVSLSVCVLILTLVYLITNILKVSLCSYSDSIIAGNIFDWFFLHGKYSFFSLASRGIFSSVIISYLLILFLPCIFYYYVSTNNNKQKIFFLILIVFEMLSCFIVGTKATTFGFVICYVALIVLYLFFIFFKKQFKVELSKLVPIVLILATTFGILPFTPCLSRIKTDNLIINNISGDISSDSNDISLPSVKPETNTQSNQSVEPSSSIKESVYYKVVLEVLGKSIANNLSNDFTFNDIFNQSDFKTQEALYKRYFSYTYAEQGVSKTLISSSYSYNADPLFWKTLVETFPKQYLFNNRFVQQKIFDRIKDVNCNSFDDYLGIAYSRTSKVFNLERDFLYQYYSVGIVGVLMFLVPYILCIIFSIIHILKFYKEKMNFLNCSLILGIGLILFLAFYSGNTLENLGISICLGILCGYLLKSVFSNK